MSSIIRPGDQLSENEWEAVKATFIKKYEENIRITGWLPRNTFLLFLDLMKEKRNNPLAFGLLIRWRKSVQDEIGEDKLVSEYSVGNISKETKDAVLGSIAKDILPCVKDADMYTYEGTNVLLHTIIGHAYTLCPESEKARDELITVCAQLYLEACERKDANRAHYFSRILLVNQYTEDGYSVCASTMYISEKTPTTTIN